MYEFLKIQFSPSDQCNVIFNNLQVIYSHMTTCITFKKNTKLAFSQTGVDFEIYWTYFKINNHKMFIFIHSQIKDPGIPIKTLVQCKVIILDNKIITKFYYLLVWMNNLIQVNKFGTGQNCKNFTSRHLTWYAWHFYYLSNVEYDSKIY